LNPFFDHINQVTALIAKLYANRASIGYDDSLPGGGHGINTTLLYSVPENLETMKALSAIILAMPDLAIFRANQQTFALPSHDIMLSLICIFNGKPAKLPRWLLEKPAALRTPEEKQLAQEFVNSIIQQDTQVNKYGPDGKPIEETSYYSIVADNPKVKAWTGIEGTLFENDLINKGEALAAAIKRAYGPEGLRHLLAFLIGLEEAGRSGTLFWKATEHLERMGKTKNKDKRAYETEDRQRALEILKILTSLVLNSENKTGKRERIQAMRLFNIDGFEVEKFDQEVINETIVLRATDIWYRNAIAPPDGRAPMFTHLLRQTAQENHQNHPLTIFMAPLFAIMWRINTDKDGWKLSVENLMKWCNLDMDRRKKAASYNKLMGELEYMTEHGYLGSYTIDQKDGGKYQDILTINPPDWLKETNKAIADKRDLYLPEGPKEQPLTQEEFTQIFKASGLNQKDFGNSLGVNQQAISKILTGKMKPSIKISNIARAKYCQN